MRLRQLFLRFAILLFILSIAVPPWVLGAESDGQHARFNQEELAQMLAPIALYPDDLLSQILMASTYPLEVVMASRWVDDNKGLKGDALAAALEDQPWDPSVKALVNFPQVLEMMNERLEWTERLGDAFLSQQEEVMNTVQMLRERAKEEGTLKTTKEQKVIVEKETIVIEPAEPTVIYVPVYNPVVVYGPWWYPAYPPFYYVPPYPPGFLIAGPRFFFWAGVPVGVPWGYAWGEYNWYTHAIFIDVHRHHHLNHHIRYDRYMRHYGSAWTPHARAVRWEHDPGHRRGVVYPDKAVAQKYHREASPETVRAREQSGGQVQPGRKDISRPSAPTGAGQSGVPKTREIRPPSEFKQPEGLRTRNVQPPSEFKQPKELRTRSVQPPSRSEQPRELRTRDVRPPTEFKQPEQLRTRPVRPPSDSEQPQELRTRNVRPPSQPVSPEQATPSRGKGGTKEDQERDRSMNQGPSTYNRGEIRGWPGAAGGTFQQGAPGKR